MAFDEAKFRAAAKAAGYSDKEINAELKGSVPAGAAPAPSMDDTFAEKERALREEYEKKVKQATTSEISIGDRTFEIPTFFTSPAGIVTAVGAGIGLGSTLIGAGAVAPKIYQSIKNRYMTKEPEIDRTRDIPMGGPFDNPPVAQQAPATAAAPDRLQQAQQIAEENRQRGIGPKPVPVPPTAPLAAPVAPPEPVSTPITAAPVDAPAPTPTPGPNSPVTTIVNDTVKEMIQETPAQPVAGVTAPPASQSSIQSADSFTQNPDIPKPGYGIGREGYSTPVEIDASKFKQNYELTTGEPLAWNEAKAESIRSGKKSIGNPEIGIKEGGENAGKWAVNDGRHRISVAADQGKKITVWASPEQAKVLQEQFGVFTGPQAPANLIAAPVAPPQELRTGTGKPAFAGMGPEAALNKKGEPKFKVDYASVADVPSGYAFVPGAQYIDTPRQNLGQLEYTKAFTERPFPLTNELAIQQANEINRMLGRATRAEAKAAGLPPAELTPGITKKTSAGTKPVRVAGTLGALVAIPDLAKAETAGERAMAGANLLEAVLPPGFMMSGAGQGSGAVPGVDQALLLGSPYAQTEFAKKRRQQEEYTRKVGAGRGIAPPSAYQR